MSANEPRAKRQNWPAQTFSLADAPGDDLSASTTPTERLAMVAVLSARMWELSGIPATTYARATIPVHVVRDK